MLSMQNKLPQAADGPGVGGFNLPALRSSEDPRDWHRPWRDPPGFFLPNCPCCGCTGAIMYSLGGANTTLTTQYATCDKTTMCNETTVAASTGNLSSNRFGAGSAANPATAGYICGGATNSSTFVATGDKLAFSNDTTAAISSANLSFSAEQIAAQSERVSKCYFAGGLNSGGKAATADKLAFSNDTNSAQASANLSQARSGAAGSNGSSAKGYWGGGTTVGVNNTVVTGEKLTYSSDATAATTSVNLKAAREQHESGGDGSTKAYWFSGQNNSGIATNVDKTAVSTDTTAATTAATGGCASDQSASGSDGNKLLAMGGNDAGGNSGRATGSKITFSTDVSTALASSANLSQGRILVAGITTVAL
jgi:hypothetical protein